MLQVLHINQSSLSGGAAIAVLRLHSALQDNQVNSKILVGQGYDSEHVKVVRKKFVKLENSVGKLTNFLGLNYINIFDSFILSKHPWIISSDIIHLHNLHGDYFNYLALPLITKNKKVVITLHDMWAFTGHCSSSIGCSRWEKTCGSCPSLDIFPEVNRDATHIEWYLKHWVWNKIKPHIISPSKWLDSCISASMLSEFGHSYIPHGIALDIYKPLDQQKSRWALDIPPKSNVILAMAQSFSDPWKGMDLLVKAIKLMPSSLLQETVLLLIGRCAKQFQTEVPCQVLSLGYVLQERLKVIAYSAASVFVHPSRAEAFGLVIQESLSCGTPVVAFNVGGVSDQITHGQNGFMASPFCPSSLSKYIQEILSNELLRSSMSCAARQKIEEEFSIDLQVRRTIKLYETL